MKLILPFGVALLGLIFSGAARAQSLQVPRVEVGGEGGILGAIGEGLHLRPTAGPRLTFNISRQDAIELAADTLFLEGSRSIYGLYFRPIQAQDRAPFRLEEDPAVLHGRNRRVLQVSEGSRAPRDAAGRVRRRPPRAFDGRTEPLQHRDIRRRLRAGSQRPCVIPARGRRIRRSPRGRFPRLPDSCRRLLADRGSRANTPG